MPHKPSPLVHPLSKVICQSIVFSALKALLRSFPVSTSLCSPPSSPPLLLLCSLGRVTMERKLIKYSVCVCVFVCSFVFLCAATSTLRYHLYRQNLTNIWRAQPSLWKFCSVQIIDSFHIKYNDFALKRVEIRRLSRIWYFHWVVTRDPSLSVTSVIIRTIICPFSLSEYKYAVFFFHLGCFLRE